MANKVNNFAYFKDTEIGNQLTFTYGVYDENGNMIRNNIRKSMRIQDTDTEILEAIQKIVDYIELDINK